MKTRGGFTLLELLLISVLIGVVFNLLAAVFVMNFRISAVASKQLLHSQERIRLDDQFVETIHRARGIVPEFAGYKTNDEQIVVELDSGARVVFGPLAAEGRLGKLTLDAGGTVQSMVTYRRDIEDHAFIVDGPLVTMRVRFAKDGSGTEHVVQAAMRNVGAGS